MRQNTTRWWQLLTQTQRQDRWRLFSHPLHGKKAVMILDIKELGDRKPSEVIDRMLAVLPFFWHIFLRLLPEAIRAPLANSSNNSDYRALVKEADNLYNSMTPNGTVCITVQQPMKSHADLSEIDSNCWFHPKFGSNTRR